MSNHVVSIIDAPTMLGHADRPVTVVGGVAAKRYLGLMSSAVVHREMVALWESPFGASRRPAPGLPRPLHWWPHSATLEMEALVGEALGSRGDLGGTVERAGEAAALLADLHASGFHPQRRRPNSRVIRSVARKAEELEDPAWREVALALVDTCPAEGSLVANHGDFSPRNVFVTPTGLRLIDFDRLQLAAPGRDVAYWGAWAFATLLLAGQTPSWTIGDDFATAYRRHGGRCRDLDWHRAAALVRIAHGWSALAARPDLRASLAAEAQSLLSS